MNLNSKVLVFDMESKLTNKIVKILDGLNTVTSCCVPWKMHNRVNYKSFDYIIVSGCSKIVNPKHLPTITVKNGPYIPKSIQDKQIPILGICYGQQWLGYSNGSKIIKGNEKGLVDFSHDGTSDLFKGLPKKFKVHMYHKWQVKNLPKGWKIIGNTKDCKIAAMEKNHMYGIQFHPEHDKTEYGRTIIRNFLKLDHSSIGFYFRS